MAVPGFATSGSELYLDMDPKWQSPRLVHLATWMLWTFVLYGAYETLAFSEVGSGASWWAGRIFVGVDGVIYGASITCVLILFIRFWRGEFNPRLANPGHLLALKMVIDVVLPIGVAIAFHALEAIGAITDAPPFLFELVGWFVLSVFPLALWIGAIYWFWHQTAWRAFFIAETLFSLSLIISPSMDSSIAHASDVGTLIVVAILVFAIARDFASSSRVDRDWIHYAGTAALFAKSSWRLMWNLFMWRFFLPMG